MISIIVPFFNEEESLRSLYQEITKFSSQLDRLYEIIFVDDGSTDKSLSILKSFAQVDNHVRIFSFRRNQGKAEALTIGFAKAKGDYVITLDADLQDKPSEIKKILEKTKEGWDVVCGWRKNRKDSIFKIISSKIFNALAEKLWGLRLHDYNCGLKVFSKDAAKSLRLYGGLHRFIPVLLYMQGFSVSEEIVLHESRKFGRSKYGISKLWKDLPDIFTMFFLIKYSNRPFHFFGVVGFIIVSIGSLILVYLSILHFQGQTIGTRPLLFFGMLLVLSGFQVFFTGFLADLIINISYRMEKNNLPEKEKFSIKYSTD